MTQKTPKSRQVMTDFIANLYTGVLCDSLAAGIATCAFAQAHHAQEPTMLGVTIGSFVGASLCLYEAFTKPVQYYVRLDLE